MEGSFGFAKVVTDCSGPPLLKDVAWCVQLRTLADIMEVWGGDRDVVAVRGCDGKQHRTQFAELGVQPGWRPRLGSLRGVWHQHVDCEWRASWEGL